MVRRYSSGIDDPVDAFRPLGNERSIVMLGVDTAMQHFSGKATYPDRMQSGINGNMMSQVTEMKILGSYRTVGLPV